MDGLYNGYTLLRDSPEHECMAQEPFFRLWPTVLLLSLSLPNFHLILIPDIHSYLKYSSGNNIFVGRQTWTAQACYIEALTAFY